MSGYVKRPAKRIDNSKGRVFRGREEILKCLGNELSGDSWSLVLETYPGVCEEERGGDARPFGSAAAGSDRVSQTDP